MFEQPKGDIWELKDTDTDSQYHGRIFKLYFAYIKSSKIKNVVKNYVWDNYRSGNITTAYLQKIVSQFKWFNSYAEMIGITSLSELSNKDICNFMSYTKTVISDETKKPLSYATQKKCLDIVKTIIHWSQIHFPNLVPCLEIFTGNEYPGINQKIKIEFIPDDIVIDINEALKNEKNVYIKYGIIILEFTGMRLGDLLKLTTDCIQPHLINGYTIAWFEHKTRRIRQPIPVRNECVVAVEKLIEATQNLREQANDTDKKYIFLNQVKDHANFGEILPLSKITFRFWLRKFIKRNNIINYDGEPFKLTSHQFRRTLATDMLSKGTNINVIQKVLGHVDPYTTTRYYADVKDKERAEISKNIGVIGNINMINADFVSDPLELTWIRAHKEQCVAGLCDGYCTKPFTNGKICDRLLNRQKCYTCSRYITTPVYLEAHKNHLKSLESQLEVNAIYGEHYAEHFRATIEVLKVIIGKLEEFKYGN